MDGDVTHRASYGVYISQTYTFCIHSDMTLVMTLFVFATRLILNNIYIRFGTKLYRQIVGIPMGTNCAPLVADFILYCYERDFVDSLKHDNQADVIEAFYRTSRYLDDLLNVDNPYFESMVYQIYPPELQLNKANIQNTETPFLDLHLFVTNGFVSCKIYDKRDDFDFDIVNFRFFWMVTFLVVILMVYTFRNLFGLLESAIMLQTSTLEINLLKQGYRYHKLRKIIF